MKLDINELEKRASDGRIKKFIHPSGKYIGWNYTDKCQYDRLWDEYTLISRGIVTLPDGTLISRPFGKFFNLGEPEAEPIPWNEPYEITEKLDGSLIVVSFYKGDVIINSRGSFASEHAVFASDWLHTNVLSWIETSKNSSLLSSIQYTYCFEAIFPEDSYTKVINYKDKRNLTLLAIINNNTGEEISHNNMKFYIPYTEITPMYTPDNISEFINKCKSRDISEGEGIVIKFTRSNKRIKIKSDEYIRLHRVLNNFNQKTVLDGLINGDDLETIFTNIPDENYKELQLWIDQFNHNYNTIKSTSHKWADDVKSLPTRKDQSLYLLKNLDDKDILHIIFGILDGDDVKKRIWDTVRKKFIKKSL